MGFFKVKWKTIFLFVLNAWPGLLVIYNYLKRYIIIFSINIISDIQGLLLLTINTNALSMFLTYSNTFQEKVSLCVKCFKS